MVRLSVCLPPRRRAYMSISGPSLSVSKPLREFGPLGQRNGVREANIQGDVGLER